MSTHWVSGYPNLVAEWHPTRNGELSPSEVSYGSAAQHLVEVRGGARPRMGRDPEPTDVAWRRLPVLRGEARLGDERPRDLRPGDRLRVAPDAERRADPRPHRRRLDTNRVVEMPGRRRARLGQLAPRADSRPVRLPVLQESPCLPNELARCARARDRSRMARSAQRSLRMGRPFRLVAQSVVALRPRPVARVVRRHRLARTAPERMSDLRGQEGHPRAVAREEGTGDREGVAPHEERGASPVAGQRGVERAHLVAVREWARMARARQRSDGPATQRMRPVQPRADEGDAKATRGGPARRRERRPGASLGSSGRRFVLVQPRGEQPRRDGPRDRRDPEQPELLERPSSDEDRGPRAPRGVHRRNS